MCLSKLRTTTPHGNIHVTSKSPVGDISVVTLIRTDTTLDHSQKAEKVCTTKGWLDLASVGWLEGLESKSTMSNTFAKPDVALRIARASREDW